MSPAPKYEFSGPLLKERLLEAADRYCRALVGLEKASNPAAIAHAHREKRRARGHLFRTWRLMVQVTT